MLVVMLLKYTRYQNNTLYTLNLQKLYVNYIKRKKETS